MHEITGVRAETSPISDGIGFRLSILVTMLSSKDNA
jgi:hypothetical protein